MIKYLFLFLPIAPAAEAQSTNNKPAVRKINHIVKNIQRDGTLTRVSKTDSATHSSTILIIGQRQAVSYFKDSTLVRFHAGQFEGMYLSGFSRDYYFHEGKLVYVQEQISNSSRMGSCGTVTVKYDYYLRDDEVIYFRRGQPQNFYETCYGNMGPKDGMRIREALERDRKSL